MNINIIASSSNEINNRYIFDLLKNRDRSKRHIIIAPDRSLFSLEQRVFAETGEKCFFDIDIASLSRLSKKVLGKTDKNILTKQSGVALVKKILESNREKLCAFGKATSFMGFASSLFETICFYKSCNISPSDMYIDNSSSFANLKQKDIKLVYEEYEKYLQNEYTDSFNQLKLFADSINIDTFKDTIFYLLEFDDYTRIMYQIISKFARFSDGLYISCTYGKGNNNSNIFGHKVYYDLIDLFKGEGLEFKINKLDGFERLDFNLLSKNLLAYNPEHFDLTKSNISIKNFENIDHEIKYTIADIYSDALINNRDFSKYTIVVPNLTEYKARLIQELDKYNIPYYIDESALLIDNYLIRLLFDICNIIASKDYKYSDFANIIKSPLLNFNINDINILDNYLRKINAISDMCLNSDIVANEDINAFILMIKEYRTQATEILSYSEFIDIVSGVLDYINTRAVDYIDNLNALESRTYNQVMNKLDNINSDITQVFGKDTSNFEDFLNIYKSYFESTNISLPPITSNTLFIADFNTSYVSIVDNLYILGNNEGKLPKMKLDNGLVTDEEINRLPNASRLSPTIAMLNSRKTFKLFELIFKFRNKLNLSYLTSSSEDKLYPNNLINSIIKIGSLPSTNQSNVLDVISRNYNSLDINNIVFNNLTPKLVENNLINYLSDWEVFNTNINYRKIVSSLYNLSRDNIKSIVLGFNSTSNINNLTDSNYFGKGYSSVSQIETFNMCPYLHYARYGLKLKENEDSRFKPNDIGNIIHEVLSKIVPFIVKNSDDIETIKSKASKSLEEVLRKDEYKEIVNNKSNTFVIKALYRELDRIIVAVANEIKCSEFKPIKYEYRFDNLVVDGIKLKGFIDRIDATEDGFIIIDYKTGDNSFKNFNDVLSGKKLQLLVYAKAFEESAKKSAMGAFYMPLSNAFGEESSYKLNGVMIKSDDNIVHMDGGLINENYKSDIINLKTTSTGKIFENSFYKNLCLSREEFDYLLNFAMSQVSKSIARIKLGEISPYPLKDKNKNVCDYCSFKALCNYQNDNDNIAINVDNIVRLKEIGEADGRI